jgi:glycosyltransferase involved in cell wall biosynthesis
MAAALKIAINAQLRPNGSAGGVESVVVALIAALGRLEGPERYDVVCRWDDDGWIREHAGPNTTVVRGPGKRRSPLVSALFRAAASDERLVRLWRRHVEQPRKLRPPVSDGFFERLGCDLVHFPYQVHQICGVPTVFNPHDLQHVHLPQFFSAADIVERDFRYGLGCRFAKVVVVGSGWVKRDVAAHYGIAEEKIQVIPWAAPTQALAAPTPEEIARIRARHGLERPFFYYPAMTWPHKNHLRLLEAFAGFRAAGGPDMDLVCTGFKRPDFWPAIEARIRELGLERRALFPGMLPREEIRGVYRAATAVIVPTLFEAASGPVFEAWAEGVPVACSTVTSLPEQVGDAAILFDPCSVEAMRAALCALASDAALRERLAAAGRRRLADFDWERTAKAYRAVYRKVAHRPLTAEDSSLLAWDWMRSPGAAPGA